MTNALLQVKIAHQITWFIGDACWLSNIPKLLQNTAERKDCQTCTAKLLKNLSLGTFALQESLHPNSSLGVMCEGLAAT